MKKEIVEKLALEDPVYYQSLSERIQKTIEEFRNKQISDVEYLQEMIDVRNNKITHKKRDDIPAEISKNDEASAYYSAIKPFYSRYLEDDENAEIGVRQHCQNELSETSKTAKLNELTVLTALKLIQILDLEQKVDFWNDENAIKKVINLMDDFFYDEIKAIYQLQLSTDDMDEIIDKVMQIAKYRRS
jgi:type I restriction enzyme R subunit